jgi:hypothetical protein
MVTLGDSFFLERMVQRRDGEDLLSQRPDEDDLHHEEKSSMTNAELAINVTTSVLSINAVRGEHRTNCMAARVPMKYLAGLRLNTKTRQGNR